MKLEIPVFFEDSHILVCEKPAGIPSQSGRGRGPDMINELKSRLYENNPAAGEPFLAPVHRLDQPVGGVMVFAKSPLAAKELGRQLRDRIMTKQYLAVVCANAGKSAEPVTLTDYLVRDGKTNLSRIASAKERGAKEAILSYRVLSSLPSHTPPLSLLDIELDTGRHHQIRVQLAAHLGGIWGDAKYNPLCFTEISSRSGGFPALYAYRLRFFHPKTKAPLFFENFPDNEAFSKFSGFNSHSAVRI